MFLYRHMRTEEGSTDEESLFITSKGAHTFGHSHPFLLSTSSRYLQALLFILTFTVLLPPLLVYSEFFIPPPVASHILSSVTQGGPRYHMTFGGVLSLLTWTSRIPKFSQPSQGTHTTSTEAERERKGPFFLQRTAFVDSPISLNLAMIIGR